MERDWSFMYSVKENPKNEVSLLIYSRKNKVDIQK